jgi:hypothetical protein
LSEDALADNRINQQGRAFADLLARSAVLWRKRHKQNSAAALNPGDGSRGASWLIAVGRSARVLNPMTKDEAEASGVGEDRRFHFRADIDKSNLAPSTKASWFRLANIALGNGSSGPIDDQDYVGVPKPWETTALYTGVAINTIRDIIIFRGRHCERLVLERIPDFARAASKSQCGPSGRWMVKSTSAGPFRCRAVPIEAARHFA